MKKILFIISIFVMFLMTVANIYASSGLTIRDITLVEPVDGKISGKVTILVKAIIANDGNSDINYPFSVSVFVNNRLYSSCSDKCSLTLVNSDNKISVPVNNGLKAGQGAEMYWAMTATDREFLNIGQNSVKFTAQINGQESIEKSYNFNLDDGNLPQLDLAISNLKININNNKIDSVSTLITNNGPNTLKDDVIQLSVSVRRKADNSMISGIGGFIDYQTSTCDSSKHKCEMAPGDTNTWTYSEFAGINNQLRPGTYTLTLSIDDVNGLKKFKETNKQNSEIVKEFVIESSNTNLDKPSNWFNINKGWNLVWGISNPSQIIGGLEASKIRAIYAFNYYDKSYIRTYPNPETNKLRNMPEKYYSTTAYWLYSDQEANIEYNFETPASKFTLQKGINFLGINPDMEGKTFSDMSNCKFTSIWSYTFDHTKQASWKNALQSYPEFVNTVKLKKEHTGFGLLVKVTDDCEFNIDASEKIIAPPTLPS